MAMFDLIELINSHLRHDILNDLTTIRSILEIYQDTKNGEFLNEAFKKIDSRVNFLKEMKEVESMVSEGGPKPLKLSDALKPILNKYGEHISLNVRGDCTVMAGESLTAVFDNLVRNAITHGNADRVAIKIMNKGEVCKVEITDNGEDSPDDLRERLFEEGVSSNGTGLGLYFVKKMFEGYGGSIRLESNKHGTTFVMLFKTTRKQKQEKLDNRDSGIDVLGEIGWGTHICYFYQTRDDLIDVLIPYFTAGLDNNEYCVWVTSELTKKEAQMVEERLSPGMEVIPYYGYYTNDKQQVLGSWVEKLNQALADGYDGLRVAGDTARLDSLEEFINYEEEIHGTINMEKGLLLSAYPFDRFKTTEIADLSSRHHYTLVVRNGQWEFIENFKYWRIRNVLQKVEERYRTIVENINEAVMVVQDEKIMYFNSKAMEASGYSKEELLYKPFIDFIHPDDRDLAIKHHKESVNDKKSLDSYQLRFKDKRGNTKWATLNITSIAWDGKPATLYLLTDIRAVHF